MKRGVLECTLSLLYLWGLRNFQNVLIKVEPSHIPHKEQKPSCCVEPVGGKLIYRTMTCHWIQFSLADSIQNLELESSYVSTTKQFDQPTLINLLHSVGKRTKYKQKWMHQRKWFLGIPFIVKTTKSRPDMLLSAMRMILHYDFWKCKKIHFWSPPWVGLQKYAQKMPSNLKPNNQSALFCKALFSPMPREMSLIEHLTQSIPLNQLPLPLHPNL